MHWQHLTGRYARCQFMVDVGSRAPMITVFEELVNASLATIRLRSARNRC